MSNRVYQYPRAVRWPSPAVLAWVRERIKAAGGDPTQVPETSFRLLPLSAVRDLTGLSTSTLYRMQANGTFPRPVPVDRASVRAA
jgi:predicted DNA-binding transcriptional regulator AlpA